MGKLIGLLSLAALVAATLLSLSPEPQGRGDRAPQRATAREILRQHAAREEALPPADRAAYDACRCRCGDGLCPNDDPNDPELLRKLRARARSCGYQVCTMPEGGR